LLEDQRSCLNLSGHFQPATSLLSSPPSGSSFRPPTVPAVFRWLFSNTSLRRTAQRRDRPGQKSSPCAKQDYGNDLAPGKGWVQSCLSVSRRSVFPKGQRNTFFTDARYPSTAHDPRSLWINTALNISAAELPAPRSTRCAAPNKMPSLPKAASAESFRHGAVQCLNSALPKQKGLNSALLPSKPAIFTATTPCEASQKGKSPQEKTYSSGTGSTNQKRLETGQ